MSETAREALEPFAKLADAVFRDGRASDTADDRAVWGFDDVDISHGDLRRARRVYDALAAAPASSAGSVRVIERPDNTGSFFAKTNDGRWLYLNHADQWCEFQGFPDLSALVEGAGEAETVAAGINAAIAFIEKRRDDYVKEFGTYDFETGMHDLPGTGDQTVVEWEEIIEGLRALASPSTNDCPAVEGEADEGALPEESRWHLGAMNDGLFIIDRAPGLTTDAGPWDRDDGPEMVLNVVNLTHEQAKAIVDAHNAALLAHPNAQSLDPDGQATKDVFAPLPGVVERLTRERDEARRDAGELVVAQYALSAAEARAAIAEAENERLREALVPFALDAEKWEDTVPDDYRSLCTEPGSETAYPGSETAFTVGDLRAARAALSSSTVEGGR